MVFGRNDGEAVVPGADRAVDSGIGSATSCAGRCGGGGMTFCIENIGGFNPFEWDALTCPVCGHSKFTSVSHAAIYCDKCNARFSVRMTAGDPGCVVDCHIKGEYIYAPAWECPKCGKRAAAFGDCEPWCTACTKIMDRKKGMSKIWQPPSDYPDAFYLILKHGDYCSGWLASGNEKKYNLSVPTQEEWEAFSETLRPAPGLGTTVNARSIIIPKHRAITFENVNVDYLEEQRLILGEVCAGGDMTSDARRALEGIVNMLDAWSDAEREAA